MKCFYQKLAGGWKTKPPKKSLIQDLESLFESYFFWKLATNCYFVKLYMRLIISDEMNIRSTMLLSLRNYNRCIIPIVLSKRNISLDKFFNIQLNLFYY